LLVNASPFSASPPAPPAPPDPPPLAALALLLLLLPLLLLPALPVAEPAPLDACVGLVRSSSRAAKRTRAKR